MVQLASLNEDLRQSNIGGKIDTVMVQVGMDQPLEETDFGMANPYR